METKQTQHDDLMTVEEAAARLKIHVATVRKLLREGSLDGMKFGGRDWRVPESSLQKFIAFRMKKSSVK